MPSASPPGFSTNAALSTARGCFDFAHDVEALHVEHGVEAATEHIAAERRRRRR